MFTVYVDDSGTSPAQQIAVSGALIIPALRIRALDSSWKSFTDKYEFADFHASECAALNPKSYPGWTQEKVRKVFSRARQITKQHSSKAFSFTIHKEDFDSLAPAEWLEVGGDNHYTWAFRTLLNQMVHWHRERNISAPFEFVFDHAEGRDRKEIEMLMAQFESIYPGRFEGHYSFRKRKDVPGLQCADLLAWTCFAMSRLKFRNVPMNEIAKESFSDFSKHPDPHWMDALTYEREALRTAISLDRSDVKAEQIRREWHRNYISKQSFQRGGRP
ncbi:MAG: DUF3800 domain-containing protein [Candidatus Korobacteraceae bacterium]|jgi:hypothetical protein